MKVDHTMKTLSALSFLLFAHAAIAQCDHDPVVSPDDLILCPNETATLSTQSADAYQWYKDGVAVFNAMQQTLEVSSSDAGSQFSVVATVDGCAEESPQVLVDGWFFLLPFVIHEGDPPAFIGPEGESFYCDGAFVHLVLGGVAENIQWTLNGEVIPGADGQDLVVTEDGFYSASGGPGVCPDFIMSVGVQIPIFFVPEVIPVIFAQGEDLCFTPFTPLFEWQFNGTPIVADACFTPSAGGTYTVVADYPGCGPSTSEPFDLVLGVIEEPGMPLRAWPNPSTGAFRVRSPHPLQDTWRLLDSGGRVIREGRFASCTDCAIDAESLEAGPYLLETGSHRPVRVSVCR